MWEGTIPIPKILTKSVNNLIIYLLMTKLLMQLDRVTSIYMMAFLLTPTLILILILTLILTLAIEIDTNRSRNINNDKEIKQYINNIDKHIHKKDKISTNQYHPTNIYTNHYPNTSTIILSIATIQIQIDIIHIIGIKIRQLIINKQKQDSLSYRLHRQVIAHTSPLHNHNNITQLIMTTINRNNTRTQVQPVNKSVQSSQNYSNDYSILPILLYIILYCVYYLLFYLWLMYYYIIKYCLFYTISIMADDDDCSKPICMDSPFGNMRKNLGSAYEVQCPLDRQELGRFSWALLHTFAAYYPQKPSQQDQDAMKGFVTGFKHLYPCKHCRGHFQKDCQKDPPNYNDHKQINLWVCRQHNYVNKMLGKGQFQCQYQKLMKRWKTGCQADTL